MDRAQWLSLQVQHYIQHGRLPTLPLPGERGYIGCQMVMVSENAKDLTRLDFSAHFPDAIIAAWRKRPVPPQTPRKPLKRRGDDPR